MQENTGFFFLLLLFSLFSFWSPFLFECHHARMQYSLSTNALWTTTGTVENSPSMPMRHRLKPRVIYSGRSRSSHLPDPPPQTDSGQASIHHPAETEAPDPHRPRSATALVQRRTRRQARQQVLGSKSSEIRHRPQTEETARQAASWQWPCHAVCRPRALLAKAPIPTLHVCSTKAMRSLTLTEPRTASAPCR